MKSYQKLLDSAVHLQKARELEKQGLIELANEQHKISKELEGDSLKEIFVGMESYQMILEAAAYIQLARIFESEGLEERGAEARRISETLLRVSKMARGK